MVGAGRGNLVQAGVFLELISGALAPLKVAVTLPEAIKSQSPYCCFAFEDALCAQRLPSDIGKSSSPRSKAKSSAVLSSFSPPAHVMKHKVCETPQDTV